jgi:hypothetical protein
VATDALGIVSVGINEAIFDTRTGKSVSLSELRNSLSERLDDGDGGELVLDALGLDVRVISGRIGVIRS